MYKEYYTISKERLLTLLEKEAKFDALEDGKIIHWGQYNRVIGKYLDNWKKEYNVPTEQFISFKDIAEKKLKIDFY